MSSCSTGHESLCLGTRFETNLAGQDIYASVQEFEPMTRIAWGGGPKGRTSWQDKTVIDMTMPMAFPLKIWAALLPRW